MGGGGGSNSTNPLEYASGVNGKLKPCFTYFIHLIFRIFFNTLIKLLNINRFKVPACAGTTHKDFMSG